MGIEHTRWPGTNFEGLRFHYRGQKMKMQKKKVDVIKKFLLENDDDMIKKQKKLVDEITDIYVNGRMTKVDKDSIYGVMRKMENEINPVKDERKIVMRTYSDTDLLYKLVQIDAMLNYRKQMKTWRGWFSFMYNPLEY
jgi:hypothetical protein